MPPRKRSRRSVTRPPAETPPVRFVPDPVEVTPQQAAASQVNDPGNPDPTMVATIVAAVHTALQTTSPLPTHTLAYRGVVLSKVKFRDLCW